MSLIVGLHNGSANLSVGFLLLSPFPQFTEYPDSSPVVSPYAVCCFYVLCYLAHFPCTAVLISVKVSEPCLKATLYVLYFCLHLHPNILMLFIYLFFSYANLFHLFQMGILQLKLNQFPIRAFLKINKPVTLKRKEWQRVICGICH